MKRTLLFCASGALAGALTLVYGAGRFAPSLLTAAAAFGLSAALLRALLRPASVRAAAAACLAVCIGLAAVSASFLLREARVSRAVEALCGEKGAFQMRVTGLPEPSGAGRRVSVKVLDGQGRAYPAAARVYCYGEAARRLSPGDVISAEVDFAPVRASEAAGRSLAAKGIFLTGTLNHVEQIESGSLSPATLPLYLRKYALAQTDRLFLGGAPLMRALLIGDKSNFSDSFSEQVADTGVSHIFAVSGMHLSFFVSAILVFGRNRRWVCALAIAAAFLFAAVTGFSASVVRAAVMQTSVLTAPLFRRENDSLTSLSASLLLLLCGNPYAVADVGLQLSFLSVLGLLTLGVRLNGYFSARLNRRPPRTGRFRPLLRRLRAYLGGAFSMTAAAQLFTLPLIALYFGRISLISVAANLLILWVIELITVFGWAALLLSALWLPLGSLLAYPITAACRALEACIGALASVPYASVGTDGVFMSVWVAAVCLLTALCLLLRSKRAAAVSLCIAVAGFGAAFGASEYAKRTVFELAVLDVGYGQCVVATYGGDTVVVDCGSTRAGSANVLRSHLKSRNIFEIDVFALTVNAPHHTNGAAAVMEKAERLVISPANGDAALAAELTEAAGTCGTAVTAVSDAVTLRAGAMTVTVVAPPDSRKAHRGACAVLIECDKGSAAVLGDVSDRALLRLAGDARFTDANAVVCARHSAIFSEQSKFLMKSSAEYVIISSNETGGQPAGTLNTAEEGTVRIRFR